MPVMGNLTLVVAAMSYAGQLNLTATAGSDSRPALEVFGHGACSALRSLIPAGSAAVIAKPQARPTIVKEQS
jgi:hypothetical protein